MKQRFELATHDLAPGTVLLEASAGTGKTYTLTGLLLRLLLEGTVPELGRVLVVTFTVAATDELKTRLRDGLARALAVCRGEPDPDTFFAQLGKHGTAGARILQRALADFDQNAIFTIHGFCKRVLEDAAFASGTPFAADFVEDEAPLLLQAARDALRLEVLPGSPERCAIARDEGFTPGALLRLHGEWTRHPDVVLLPEAPDPAPHEAALRQALAEAAAAVADALPRLQQLVFKQKCSPFAGDDPLPPDALPAALASRPAEQSLRLQALSHDELDRRLNRRNRQPDRDHPFFAACDRVAVSRRAATDHLRAQLLHTMAARLERRKDEDRCLSFHDLLARTAAALRHPQRGPALAAAVRARHQVALIDEFQDTDPLQYEIFRACFADQRLVLVGDPKQSIYRFRGADLDVYLAAAATAGRRQYTLDTNYRSSQPMVTAVQHLFARARPFVQDGIGLPAVQAKAADGELLLADGDPQQALHWRLVPPRCPAANTHAMLGGPAAERLLAEDTAAEIGRLLRGPQRLDDRELQPGDLAVLVREHRQGLAVQQALRRRGIAAVVGRAGDVFDTAECEELLALLQAVHEPRRLTAVRAALATRLCGFDAGALQRLGDGDAPALAAELDRMVGLQQQWRHGGITRMTAAAFAAYRVRARLLQQEGGERALTNLQQLQELLRAAEHDGHLPPAALLRWFQDEIETAADTGRTRRELRLESDRDAVQVLTVHASKGLEYEVVFCPFLWLGKPVPAGTLVERRADGKVLRFQVDKDDPAWLQADADRLAEDLRLAYVAVTRARRRCVVHHGALGSGKGSYQGALAWLLLDTQPGTDGWQAGFAERSKAAVQEWPQLVQAMVANSGGTMRVDVVPAQPSVEPLPAEPPAALPAARPLPAPRRALRRHSFTGLLAARAEAEAADPADRSDPARPVPEAVTGTGIHAFARGAAAGTCLHAVLEHVDWTALDGAGTARLVQRTLHQHHLLAATAHHGRIDPVADVLQNLRDIAAAVLPGATVTVGELCRAGPPATEWGFLLPTADADTAALRELLARHGSPATRDYATQAGPLPRQTLRGFLLGFADRVAVHDDRCYILDWKSNHLGHAAADYDPAALRAAMHEHHYVLQYQLYALALHRHLRHRRADYDPARHFGGAVYVFLRGAQAGTGNGVWFDPVPPALLDALDRWAGPTEGR